MVIPHENLNQLVKSKKKNKDEEQELFHPKINPRSSDKVTIPFSQRMQIAYEKKYDLSYILQYIGEQHMKMRSVHLNQK